MTRIAIIAAMPGELKPLVRGWQHVLSNGVHLWCWKFDEGEWVAACAGAGVDAAQRAFAQAEKDGPFSSIVSTGWAGSLNENFRPRNAYRVAGVIDARTGERLPAAVWPQQDDQPQNAWLVTSPRVANIEEKQRLAYTYGASLVDMEAAAIARLAAMRAIPFYCVKGVSDGFTDHLPDFNKFLTPQGHFLLARFVLFAVFRPWCWPALMRMGENSTRAARAIRESLLANLDPSGAVRNRNGYPNR
jgi:adenosylhomocysteine nucleosidase